MYLAQRTWLEQGPARRRPVAIAVPSLKRRGMGEASCGENPCTFADFLMPWSLRPSCASFMGCKVTGGKVEVTDTSDIPSPGDYVFGDTTTAPFVQSPSSLASDCLVKGGTWNAQLQACKPSLVQQLATFMPWVVGGLVAVVVLPEVLGGGKRRRR